ncbi:hypothetical protein PVT68_05840 [Microbulbifer bruguierae]|uniref:Glycine zipper 2TM domain-containing protein n=1 Tax=Microbulbifer bruguierae TaxID=3029061 RepID=A0ABY8NGJ8_9GAMM|nr:hypothetical protein [Microbulbifer bruguierae]WGL17815.1 hypothetical protein PVT68_05840 [Microbulbifer bruguierae]
MVKIHKLFKRLAFVGLTASLATVSIHSVAGDSGYYEGQDGYDYAIVTSVTPIYQDVQMVEPRTQCWDQTVSYQQPSPAGAIIGGLIGAAVGRDAARGYRHGYGRHRHYHSGNKGAGMAAGAAVGAVIGSAISRHNTPVTYGTEQRCQVVEQVSSRRELVGYDVNYRYNGQEFLIRTDRHPGDRIRVRVDVTPVL